MAVRSGPTANDYGRLRCRTDPSNLVTGTGIRPMLRSNGCQGP